jgi:hypothetical protein
VGRTSDLQLLDQLKLTGDLKLAAREQRGPYRAAGEFLENFLHPGDDGTLGSSVPDRGDRIAIRLVTVEQFVVVTDTATVSPKDADRVVGSAAQTPLLASSCACSFEPADTAEIVPE